MRKLGAVALLATLALAFSSVADAADKLTLQLKWVTQSQLVQMPATKN